jgi:hypothetical protein
MSASFTLVLDTQAPANPALLINDGAAVTGDRAVWVRLSTADFGAGDVSEMKVWGDVDPTADPALTVAEADATWLPYTEQIAVMLSDGEGRKYLYSRLRDDVGNETLPFTDFIDLDTTVPVVTVTTAVDRGRISKVSPYDVATFTWECNIDFVAYQVRVVPSPGSPQQAGVLIGTAAGSVNTSGGAGTGHAPVISSIRGADLEAASPGNTTKVIKVFVQEASGAWSA